MAINSSQNPNPNNLSRLKTLIGMKDLANNLLKQRTKRIKLESKYQAFQDRFAERKKLTDREKRQESKKDLSIRGRVGKFVRKTQFGIGGFFFSLLKLILTYKAVEWVSKPENLKALQGLSKGLLGIFKFLNFFVGGSIDNALSGIHDLVFGGTILEKFVGLFRGIIGLFGLRYLLNPFKLIKDLRFVIKNSGKILDIFKAFTTSGIKEGADTLVKTLSKSAGIFKHGLARGLARGFLSIFGKGGFKLISKLFTPLKNMALGLFKAGAKKTIAGIPIVGPLLDLGLNLVFGDPLDKALFKAGGSALGMGLGAFIGSVFPGPGTIVGGALGGLLGDWAASTLYDSFKSKKSDVPQLAVGGIVTRPTTAIIGEAGPEAVIPLPNIFSGAILQGPLGTISSALVGGMNALLMSMGPIGNIIRPFATQLFAPYVRQYGVKNFTFNSDLGNKSIESLKSGKSSEDNSQLSKIIGTKNIHLLKNKDSRPRSRYNSGNTIREILADIFNNIINLESTSGSGGRGGREDTGADQALTAAELDAIKASSADKRAAAHLATLEATSPQHVADVYQVILNRAAGQSGGIPAVITAKEQFTPYSAALYGGSPGDSNASSKYGGLGLTKKELFDLAAKPDGIQQLTNRFQAGNPKVAAQVLVDFESNGPLSQSAKKFVGGAQYFLGYGDKGGRRRPDGGNWFRDKYQTGGVVNPVPSQNISRNKGGYAADTGLDILTPIGSRVVSPVSGTIEYAEKGHVRQMGQDANPNMPGMQHQHSVRIRLDKPFKFGGKEIKFFYATHLYKLNNSIANKSNIKISPGDLLGLSGVANNVPHVHVGFVEDRDQNSFLNYQQVKSLLSGAPIQDLAQSPEANPSTDKNGTTPVEPEFNGANVAKLLGQLYTGLTGVPKTDTSQLKNASMDLVQSRRQVPFMSDIYMITPSSTVLNNVNMMMPVQNNTLAVSSFATLDTPLYTPRKL